MRRTLLPLIVLLAIIGWAPQAIPRLRALSPGQVQAGDLLGAHILPVADHGGAEAARSAHRIPLSLQPLLSDLPASWTHTTQADWMAGERDHLDVRTLDALGTPYGLDQDPRGAMRLRSQPGPWQKHPESPVVVPGEEGDWDDAVISEAKVIYDGETFHMWYAGRRRGPPGLKMPMDLGYAISSDGVHWTKPSDGPVLVRGPLGGYDENMITAPAVLYDGTQFHMWFCAVDFRGDWSVNYATSADGIRWRKSAANPLLEETHDDRWDADYVAEPSVLYDGTGFQMWYNGASSADTSRETVLGHAVSSDGVQWTRFEESRPVFDVAEGGAWDDYAVARAHVMFDGELFKMWYEGHSGETWRIGYATSSNGTNWERAPDNPIVDLGPEGAWDSKVASEPFALFDGHTYWLWHSGYDGDRYRVGLVTAPAVYDARGTFISPPIESAAPVEWGTLSADVWLPARSDVRLEVTTSDDGQAWGDWAVAATGIISGVNRIDLTGLGLPRSRYLRYRAMLVTSDPSVSPLVREITITEAEPDFAVGVSLPAVSLLPGQRAKVTVSLSPVRGFDAPVRLSVEGGSSDVVTAWSPRAIVPPASVEIAVGTGLSVQPGTMPLTITAVGGDRAHTAVLSMVIAAPTATPTATPTVAPTPTLPPLPVSTPLPPVDPQPLWLGVGLAGGSVGMALVLAILSLLRRGRARAWWRAWVWAILLLAILAAGLVISWQYVEARRLAWADYQAHIRPGVTVAGLDAGGLTQDELYQVVATRVAAPYRREIVVCYGERSATLDTGTLDLQTNLDQIVAQAAAIGQEEATQEFRSFLTQNPASFDVHLPLTYTLNDDLLVPWIGALADEIETPPVEHAWDSEGLIFTRGRPGTTLDANGALRELQAALPDLSVHEVELPVVQVEPAAWTDDEIAAQVSSAAAQWDAPSIPAAIEQITIPFDAERWIGPDASADDWQPTRPMTGYAFLPGQMGWTLDVPAVAAILRSARGTEAPLSSTQAFTDVAPPALTLDDVKPALLEIAGHFDGRTGLYIQDLETGDEIRHNTYVTMSGTSMIKVAIMATAYRSITRPFSAELEDAISEMIAHSINAKSNYVILQIGEGDFQQGMMRVNDTLQAMDMYQTYIASAYRVADGPTYERIPVPERPAVAIPPQEQIDLWPDPAMQTSLSDQVILFEALYRGIQGTGRLLEAFSGLTPEDCQEMIDLLKTNPTRTLLGPGFADDVPLAHKNGFGGGQATDERIDVGIVWPPGGRPYLVGLYQWDKNPWIHWLRVWPQQIELSTTLYRYFTMLPTRPAPDRPW